ncbi:MAG: T9SS type A sorting domain-containing protein [Bacteroidales bacterium]|nr:T9SS type A sorting domain-containing protein [Bacteroidales bacterium]
MSNLNSKIISTGLNLKSGIYLIKIVCNKGFQTEKLVVK